jgi:hypothetical protein
MMKRIDEADLGLDFGSLVFASAVHRVLDQGRNSG